MSLSPAKLSREQLYAEVWETPIHRLSVKYGLSDVGLAKACKRMDIPRPPRGYWRRRTTGAKVHKTPLPKAKESTQLEITFRESGEVPTKRIVAKQTKEPARPPVVDMALTEPHPLVAAAKERLDAAGEDRYGIVTPKPKRVLAIRVARESIDRCLRLMDTLIKSWESEGLLVRLVKQVDSAVATCLCAGEESLQIRIEKGFEEYDPGPDEEEKLRPKWEWKKRTACRSTGQITFRLDGDYTSVTRRFNRRFQDREGVPVELRARQIWAAGMDYFDKRKQHAIEQEQRRVAAEARRRRQEEEQRRWQEECERREEERRRREAEIRRIEELATAADAWARAERIRNFIPACERWLQDEGAAEEEIAAWTDWAWEAADSLSPLTQGFPKLPSRRNDETQ